MQTRLGKLVQARALKAGTHNDSGFALVGNAELAFTSRMTLIKAAQKTLDYPTASVAVRRLSMLSAEAG